MSNIVLYAFNFRSRSERVIWALNELCLDYKLVRIDPLEKESLAELKRYNPEGKVPVLLYENQVYTESLAIIEYLNLKSNAINLVPTKGMSVYNFRRLLQFGLTEIEPYLWIAEQTRSHLKNYYRWPNGVYGESIKRVAHCCKILSQEDFSGTYLLANEFTMADIYFYHILTWAKQHGILMSSKIENYLYNLENRTKFPREMNWK